MSDLSDKLQKIRYRADVADNNPASWRAADASRADTKPLLGLAEGLVEFITAQLLIPNEDNGGYDEGYDAALMEVHMTMGRLLGVADEFSGPLP